MKRASLLFLALVMALTLAAPALAAPPGKGLESFPVTCDGQEVVITVSAGSSFWVGDRHYVLTSFSATFTPVEGSPETFTQNYGNKTGLSGTRIACSASFEDPNGIFEVEVTAVAVPPRG